MKTSELRELTVEELENRLETLRREIYNLKFKGVVEQIEDNSIFKKNRREIACIQTLSDLTFFQAVLGAVVAGLISQGLAMLLGLALSPLSAWITQALFGPEALSSTREIYEMYAARNQVVQE